MDRHWEVNAACDKVTISSTIFETEPKNDYVTINGTVYSGNAGVRQTISARSFGVSFVSDGGDTRSGFALDWQCPGSGYDNSSLQTERERGIRAITLS